MPYTYRFYRFGSASAFAAAWAAAGLGVGPDGPYAPPGGGALDVVGLVAVPGAGEDGAGVPVPGFHANAAFATAPPASLEPFAIAPFVGLRAFSGWDAPVPPPPPARSIRLLQFLAEGAARGIFSADEALAAAKTGAVPAAIDAIFATLPAADAFAARLAWAAMVDVDRDNPLLALVAASRGMGPADMDDFFRSAAAR